MSQKHDHDGTTEATRSIQAQRLHRNDSAYQRTFCGATDPAGQIRNFPRAQYTTASADRLNGSTLAPAGAAGEEFIRTVFLSSTCRP